MNDDYKITFIRGATTASGNSVKEIEDAVVELIKKTLDNDGDSNSEDLIRCLDFTKEISKALKHN